MTTCKEILGKHHHEIEGLVEEWSKKQDFGRRQVGLDTLKLLKERKKPFYYTSNSFDYPDHPFKALPLPKGTQTPSYADVLSDILKIQRGQNCDAVQMSTSIRCETAPSGAEMLNHLILHLASPSIETWSDLILPFSCPMPKTPRKDGDCGIYFDAHPHISNVIGKYYEADSTWGAAFVCAPAFTPVHNDHILCGQLMFHFFGRKIWLIGVADDGNMTLMGLNSSHNKSSELENMRRFVLNSPNLVVWDCSVPSIFLCPPHCFHSVFTLEMACHSGMRVASFEWIDEVQTILKHMEGHIDIVNHSILDIVVPDCATWMEWLDRVTMSEEERLLMERMCDVLSSWIKRM